jgi:hypothetical protein
VQTLLSCAYSIYNLTTFQKPQLFIRNEARKDGLDSVGNDFGDELVSKIAREMGLKSPKVVGEPAFGIRMRKVELIALVTLPQSLLSSTRSRRS